MVVLSISTGNEIGLGLLAGVFVVFGLVSALLIPRSKPGFPANMRAFVLVAFCLFGVALFGIFHFAKESHAGNEALGQTGTTTVEGAPPQKPGLTTTTSGSAQGKPNLVEGKTVFETSGCSGCHTLKAAGATGTVGPNLDQLKPSAARIQKQVLNGGKIMPAFRGKLDAAQIADVSAYVASVAGKS